MSLTYRIQNSMEVYSQLLNDDVNEFFFFFGYVSQYLTAKEVRHWTMMQNLIDCMSVEIKRLPRIIMSMAISPWPQTRL